MASDQDGKEIALLVSNVEFETLIKWQNENFSVSEEEYAKAWKEASAIDLDPYKTELIRSGFAVKAKDLCEVRDLIDAQLRRLPQEKLLLHCCRAENFSAEEIFQVFYRWNDYARMPVRQFAPYSYYCVLVELVFAHGLASGLIRTSKYAKSNVDLQYVFYFPFTSVFASHDNFHKKMWEVFGNEEKQVFLDGEELKSDLQLITEDWRRVFDSELNGTGEKFGLREAAPHPPAREGSVIFETYEKMVALKKVLTREQAISYRNAPRDPEEDKATAARIIEKYRRLKEGK